MRLMRGRCCRVPVVPTLVMSVAIGLCLALPSLLRADPPVRIDCEKAYNTVEMKYCAGEALKRADEDLNSSWVLLTRDLDPGFKQSLVAAQRAWITFRDRNCEAETYLSRGGTGYTLFYDICLERMTRQRTEALRTLLEEN
ncbi:MAG: DUF1311 domain-containing protein [Magnetococcales bacterium]|nr:DUF1311 domain-containing protein [Magnetococcales bacterium]